MEFLHLIGVVYAFSDTGNVADQRNDLLTMGLTLHGIHYEISQTTWEGIEDRIFWEVDSLFHTILIHYLDTY